VSYFYFAKSTFITYPKSLNFSKEPIFRLFKPHLECQHCFFYCFSTFCQLNGFFLDLCFEVTKLRDSNATYRDNLLWRIVMYYGEMPRTTLGSSDLRSQVVIFGEWNIYVCFLLFFNFLSAERVFFFQIRVTGLKFNKRFFFFEYRKYFIRQRWLPVTEGHLTPTSSEAFPHNTSQYVIINYEKGTKLRKGYEVTNMVRSYEKRYEDVTK
jgi:hypothetical protein